MRELVRLGNLFSGTENRDGWLVAWIISAKRAGLVVYLCMNKYDLMRIK